MKFLTNWRYWVFGIIGWMLLIVLTLSIDKVSYGIDSVSNAIRYKYLVYTMAEGVACGILGFLLSLPILYYIEKYIVFGNLKKRNILLLLLIFGSAQIVYSIVMWPLLDFVGFLTGYETKGMTIEIDFLKRLTNIPFFAAMFSIWLFVVLVIKAYYYNKNIILQQYQLEGSLKESQLNSLKGQINPHFMFNSLNNIRGLMLEDVSRSRDMLTKLSEMLRYSLVKSDVNAIALEEEIDMVDNYIALSKIQFEDRLKFVKEIEPETLSIQIPPMIVQLLVENAAKHGIANLKKGGTITLNTLIAESNLFISVRNTGKLKIQSNSTQLGIKNIKKRLRLLYGNNAKFTLDEVGENVVAIVRIPMV